MKFTLPRADVVFLSYQTIDKLIRADSGDAALLYLHILKTNTAATSSESAAALGRSEAQIAEAAAILSDIGLLICDDIEAVAPLSQAHKTELAKNLPEAHHPTMQAQEELPEPRRFSPQEIKKQIEDSSALRSLVYETQNSLGKILSSEELERLLGIYDGLQMPVEVILLLITHCISESRQRGSGRMPSIRNIEKTAYIWEREGILTIDRADEYLKDLESKKTARGKIKETLKIKDRELSDSEKRFVDGWLDMGFDDSVVEIAFDRTLLHTGKLAWSYMNSILIGWHNKGFHSAEEIMLKDSKKTASYPRSNESLTPDKRFGTADSDEIERLKRLRAKIKEG